MDIVTQVLSVQGRTTSTQKVVYDLVIAPVAAPDGSGVLDKLSTWESATASKAQSLVGQQATLRVEKRIRGQYTNWNLSEIAGPGEQLSPLAMPVGSPAPAVPLPLAAPIPITPAGAMDPERERKIVKQSCLATAHTLVAALFSGAGPEAYDEAEKLAMSHAKKLFGEVFATQSAPSVVAPTAQAVADFANGQIPGAVAVGAVQSW